ncbi:MAG: glutamine-hydrolyzing GMP synthase [Bacteroidetes bacterium]|jgi:GMP synthase (glutamine-hydrolysing)|nr:glutamine-hydrolyzing GMP synthase [Bacteroidota bacterium]MBK6819154.1 glutamine-hydrolyzing GMP synthase [Bacteroidota bacterium]MBK7039436.1 glutamine-hydrolyzing GMP synthase [Bacteroidota bacterium]MBK8328121.1 glutamine-hydrolyzing GMP synthase [Bacteroidota bacterium]MBK9299435.1 glutamine-hydrolyzing GMP synthase [Bacteroidota bacterium]
MTEKIIILDFGSQYTQLIARNIRELNVYCEIIPFHHAIDFDHTVKGVILSGSPSSVNEPNAPHVDVKSINTQVPVLGICYGAQLTTKQYGGKVEKSSSREYGRAQLCNISHNYALTDGIEEHNQVWMSHADTITELAPEADIIAQTDNIPVAAFAMKHTPFPLFGLQFHPEVTHSENGKRFIRNFVLEICGCIQQWTPAAYIQETVEKIKQQVGNQKVVMALSGGVDSTVAATLIQQAIGENLYCIFVDNGLLRKEEFQDVLEGYKTLGLNVKGVDASAIFYQQLKGVSDPEEKRKIIGGLFIDVFQEEATHIKDIHFLGQGTIYPDVIESVSVNGPSATIKSHHNVGGLPEKMHMALVEPLRYLFKDEVRKIGRELLLDDNFLQRHPFPGPGLGIRILGEVTAEKVTLLQEADAIFINIIKEKGIYHDIWQAGTMLLPIQSVGVMGDERTYEFTVALRAVTSIDGMTADWAHIPYDILALISNEIINKVKGVNRVVYDISSKPPATIEWE